MNNDELINEISNEEIAEEYETFIELYKTKSLIDYSNIEFAYGHLLEKSNKYILNFFRKNNFIYFHNKILKDIF